MGMKLINIFIHIPLQFKFAEGKPRGFGIHAFDWGQSQFSRFFHLKQVKTGREFYEVWTKCVAPSLDSTTGLYRTTREEQDGNQVPPPVDASATPVPVEIPATPESTAATPSTSLKTPVGKRKRSQNENQTPNIRPLKVIHRESPVIANKQQEKDLDKAIESVFVGMYILYITITNKLIQGYKPL